MPGIGQGHKRETPFKSSNTLWETKNIQDTTPALYDSIHSLDGRESFANETASLGLSIGSSYPVDL